MLLKEGALLCAVYNFVLFSTLFDFSFLATVSFAMDLCSPSQLLETDVHISLLMRWGLVTRTCFCVMMLF